MNHKYVYRIYREEKLELQRKHPCPIDYSAGVFVGTRFRETLARLFCFYSERPDEGYLGSVRAAEKVS